MRFIKLLSLLLTVILMLMSVTACTSDYRGAYIYIDFDSTPTCLDPQLADTDEELTVVRSLFDTLLRYNDEGKLIPSATESYEKNSNTYTFKLRKDSVWLDGTPVTSYDFVFAFRRAVDPETSAPFANTLFSIENAEEIRTGGADISTLGITATDEYTLVIKLERDDPEFEKVLTSAITMPCNQAFFDDCKGKYGLTVETTASNGSYYVRKWNTDTKFLIRLAKNLDYKGPFDANSMRVYYTCGEDEAFDMLNNDNTDLIYVSNAESDGIVDSGFEVSFTENICYALFLSPKLDPDIRKALLTSVNTESITSVLGRTQNRAETLYPAVLTADNIPKVSDYIKYDTATAHSLYADMIKGGFKLGNIAIKYPADTSCETVAKSIAGHWQQTLSCFINIEEISESAARSAYNYGTYDILILPFYSVSGTTSAYNSDLGYNSSDAAAVSKELYENYRCYPLFFSTTNIAAGYKIQNLKGCIQNGILDASLLIKQQ